jgi:hypothetical protein
LAAEKQLHHPGHNRNLVLPAKNAAEESSAVIGVSQSAPCVKLLVWNARQPLGHRVAPNVDTSKCFNLALVSFVAVF